MKKLLIALAVVVSLASLAGAAFHIMKRAEVVPSNIKQQAGFVILYPAGDQLQVQKETFKFDPSTKSLSFVVSFNGHKLTFAEQISPDEFADDPNYYPGFVNKLNGFATFESVNGRVDLVRPNNVPHQTAVMNAKGTLLFVQSDGDMEQDAWRQLFNHLLIAR